MAAVWRPVGVEVVEEPVVASLAGDLLYKTVGRTFLIHRIIACGPAVVAGWLGARPADSRAVAAG